MIAMSFGDAYSYIKCFFFISPSLNLCLHHESILILSISHFEKDKQLK